MLDALACHAIVPYAACKNKMVVGALDGSKAEPSMCVVSLVRELLDGAMAASHDIQARA